MGVSHGRGNTTEEGVVVLVDTRGAMRSATHALPLMQQWAGAAQNLVSDGFRCFQTSISSDQMNTPLLRLLAPPPPPPLPPPLLLPFARMVPPLLTMLLLGAWHGSTSFLMRQRRLGVNTGSRPTSWYPSRSYNCSRREQGEVGR